MKSNVIMQIILVFLFIIILASIAPLHAQNYVIKQLSDNARDEGYSINNGQVVWVSARDGSDSDIFLYNGIAVYQISSNEFHDRSPQIDNDQIAWEGHDNNDSEIFLYNGSSTIQLTNNNNDDFVPRIKRGKIVWPGYVNSFNQRILFYNGINTIQISNFYGTNPQIDNDGNVVWQGSNGGIDSEIFLYNGATTAQLTNNNYDDANPQIDSGQVVWQSYDGHDYEIFFYDGVTSRQLTNNDEDDISPQISNGWIVWQSRGLSGEKVFLYNGINVVQLTDNRFLNTGVHPKIHNGEVVWFGWDGNDNEIFIYYENITTQITDNNYDDLDPQINNRQVVWKANVGGNLQIFLATPNDGSILNMTQMPWRQNTAPYNSTGAAASQMILDYIREGAGQTLLSQNAIYEYAKSPQAFGSDLNPDEIDKVLGHFDPYDTLVSNWADSYDTLADGNPYQGYNYSVDTYDPKKDPEAMNKYMRDICHWMAYSVTKEDWWKDGELVARPNTPAVVPLYGTYDHWVVVKGYAASKNPCPEPHTNPRNTPDFTVYGFWFKDPLVNGIGQDTYKSAAECKATYFLPLTIAGAYNGLLLQVAEPPAEISRANAKIEVSSKDLANLQFVGVKTEVNGNKNGAVAMLSESAMGLERKPPAEKIKKQSWKDLVDKRILADSEAVSAFKDTVMARPILVKRADKLSSNYYLVPFNKTVKGRGALTSAVVVLDANSGFFKEASWAKKPELFLGVDKNKAIGLVLANILLSRQNELRRLAYVPRKEYIKQMDMIIRKYAKLINYIQNAKAELMWQPKGYSPSPYKPYWKVDANGYVWYVTQEGKIIPEVELKRILNEIERNIGLITNIRYTSTR